MLVSIGGSNGRINVVAPFSEYGVKALNRGWPSNDGKFVAIYDAHGKIFAPSGASHIELDAKTGTVSSCR
ncbi:MAG TPA: hypothetical protein VG944_10385 [Fimbriimonas sp.]|nr:hypothetical protein [Fimbriimonas sp.]